FLHHRPSNEACMDWLHGQRILLKEGLLLNDYWTIHRQEFTSFQIKSIHWNRGRYTAQVQFGQRSGSKAIQVQATLVYGRDPKRERIVFQSFTVNHWQPVGL